MIKLYTGIICTFIISTFAQANTGPIFKEQLGGKPVISTVTCYPLISKMMPIGPATDLQEVLEANGARHGGQYVILSHKISTSEIKDIFCTKVSFVLERNQNHVWDGAIQTRGKLARAVLTGQAANELMGYMAKAGLDLKDEGQKLGKHVTISNHRFATCSSALAPHAQAICMIYSSPISSPDAVH